MDLRGRRLIATVATVSAISGVLVILGSRPPVLAAPASVVAAASRWAGIHATSALGAAVLFLGATVLVGMALWSRSLRAQVQRRTRELRVSLEMQAEQARIVARAQVDASRRARQQAAIAALGQRALAGIDVQLLIDQASSMVCSTLQVTAVAVFEVVDDGAALLLKAGHGWRQARTGATKLASTPSVYPGSALAAESVVTPAAEVDPFFAEERLPAGAAMKIPGLPSPYGILLVADRADRGFTRDDLHFLHAVANVIGAAFERNAMEVALREALAVNRATLEATADGILVTDAAGRVTGYNQRLVDIWGIRPDQLPPDEAADIVAGSDGVRSAVVTRRDGRVIERQSYPQRLDGRVIGRVWSYRDISERVRAESERRKLETQMQHIQKLESLGVLAGGVAHDFNNLLVGILGNAGLAAMDAPPGSTQLDLIKQIETAAQRAAELTNQMLAYSGKGRFVLERIDVSCLVDETAPLLRSAISRHAQLALMLDGDLPECEGDPTQLRQVIVNLITNASDAIGAAAGRIEVRTGLCRATREYLADAHLGADLDAGDFVFIEVGDDGCGMDATTLSRIFDPFFSTKFTGRGLGLAAVLGIVRGHAGAIAITTGPGEGTTFRVLLPVAGAATARRTPVAAASPRATGRILVVDDEASVRRVASQVLSRAGFDVEVASDGDEAVEVVRARGGEIDAVLLDMTMPRMNGADAFRAMRALEPGLRVVLTSGYSEQDATARFGTDGLAAFLQKPFLPATLVRAMTEAIRGAAIDDTP